MSWDRSNRVLVSAAAIVVLAACAGGMSNVGPTTSIESSNNAVPAPPKGLQLAQAPTATIKQLEAQTRPNATVPSPSPSAAPGNPLTNWQLLEPLYITPALSFKVLPWIKQCSTIDLVQGVWYLGLFNFSMPLSPFDLPACTIPSPAQSQVFAAERPDSVLPSTRLYVVEFDVDFASTTSTPIASESPNSTSNFQMEPLESAVTYKPGHLYAFFLAEWLGAPPAVTQSS